MTGLTNGTRYYFRVLAKNAAGSSASSNVANNIPRTVPSAARSLTATPGNRSVVLRVDCAGVKWRCGDDRLRDPTFANGSTGWATINDDVRTTTSYTVTGLSNGTRYYFRVLGKNAAGTGASSNVVNQIPRTVPSAPALRATRGNARVTLAWTPPTLNGGSAITRNVIQRSTSPTSGWVDLSTTIPATARSFTATGLHNGTRYYFRIAAVNAAGAGPWSAVVSAVPVAPPPPPQPPPPPPTNCDASYPTVCFRRHHPISIAVTSPFGTSSSATPIRTDSTATTTASAAQAELPSIHHWPVRPGDDPFQGSRSRSRKAPTSGYFASPRLNTWTRPTSPGGRCRDIQADWQRAIGDGDDRTASLLAFAERHRHSEKGSGSTTSPPSTPAPRRGT